jgi:hypothetical protein
MSQTER